MFCAVIGGIDGHLPTYTQGIGFLFVLAKPITKPQLDFFSVPGLMESIKKYCSTFQLIPGSVHLSSLLFPENTKRTWCLRAPIYFGLLPNSTGVPLLGRSLPPSLRVTFPRLTMRRVLNDSSTYASACTFHIRSHCSTRTAHS